MVYAWISALEIKQEDVTSLRPLWAHNRVGSRGWPRVCLFKTTAAIALYHLATALGLMGSGEEPGKMGYNSWQNAYLAPQGPGFNPSDWN